jgi:hypothetical protein
MQGDRASPIFMFLGEVLISECHFKLWIKTELVGKIGVVFSEGRALLASFECFLVEEGNLGADAGKERSIFLLLQISEEVDKLLGLSQTELATHDECLAGHIRGLVLRRQLSGERDEVGEEPSGLLEPVARIFDALVVGLVDLLCLLHAADSQVVEIGDELVKGSLRHLTLFGESAKLHKRYIDVFLPKS